VRQAIIVFLAFCQVLLNELWYSSTP